MLLGAGSNGKSIALAALRTLLGWDNVAAIPLQVLAEDRFKPAELYGRLANVCGDLDHRALKRTDLFKQLTGSTDAIFAERKYGHPFSFVPFATQVFSANEVPASADQSDAFYSRWVILPFPRTFAEVKDADPHLLGRLITEPEMEGYFVRAVEGLRRLEARGGFELPESVREASGSYRERTDTIHGFADEVIVSRPGMRVRRGQVYEQYRQWCARNGRYPQSNQKFVPGFKAEIERSRSRWPDAEENLIAGVWWWRNINAPDE